MDFWYQDASGTPSDAAWQRVRNGAGVDQVLTGLTLAPQSSDRWSVDWAPVSSAGSRHFSVRAVVTVPGDPNTDNKRCMSSFGSVVALDGLADLELVRRPFRDPSEDVQVLVVPRARGSLSVSQADLARANSSRVRGGSERLDVLRVRRSGAAAREADGHAERAARGRRAPRAGGGRPPRLPDPKGHYRTAPGALPPGMESADLVTVAHRVQGRVVGGFTWAIRDPV